MTASTGFDAATVHNTVMTVAEPILDEMMGAPQPGVRHLYATDGDVDKPVVERNVTGPAPRLEKFVAGVQANVLRLYTVIERVFRKDAALRVDSYDIRGGNVGITKRVAGMLAQNMNYLDDVAMDALIDSTNGLVCYDGQQIFSTSHPHGYLGATQVNLTSNAPTFANVKASHVAMTSLKRENGQSFAIDPDTILCGPTLGIDLEAIAGARGIIRAAALNAAGAEATSSVVAAAGVSNVLAGRYNVIVDPRIVSTTTWFMLDSKLKDKALEVGRFDGGVRLVAEDQYDSPSYVKTNEFLYQLIADVVAVPGAWQGISKHGA